MSTTFRLNADDLDASFLEKLRLLYQHKDVAIVVYEEDATEFLQSNPKNYARLLESLDEMNRREGLVELDAAHFE